MSRGDDDTIRLEAAQLTDVLPLRTRVLRPHLPPGTLAHFPGDDLPQTRHFAAWSGEEVIAVASFYLNTLPDSPQEAWQLRGMAVAPHFQGRGFGGRLLQVALTHLALARHQTHHVWCNARQSAQAFYQRHGFQVISAPFTIEGVGPHVKMSRTLPTLLA
ncbi:GNAT family N-acetyltransferase [Lujinxingia litoralis]|uniref:GNAT family N-acetyltransferase n=1 Tax=Lujinxingia litoralis TaxID=2211119 RepID=A0A328C7P2_9DELT|nr:GNAT family N-acetyltransferase [Lujinxingia litoralis]RAL22434.1 GNAT family N-acetyltransferase [Lujinxingia litoralis]